MKAQDYLKARGVQVAQLKDVSVGRLSIDAEFKFAGQTHTGIDITATVQGMTVYERQVYLMADSCMYVVTATAYEENGAQAMLDTFTALN